jgi:hypothetical protein
LTGLAGDAEYAARARLRCQALARVEASPPELLAAFDEGVAAARADMSGGLFPLYKPDEDTLLGADSSPAEPRSLATVRRQDAPPERVLATWVFSSSPPSVAGWAMGARIRRAETRSDEVERPYLRFGGFGTSEVELGFGIEGHFAQYGPVLVLSHVAAARDAFPGHGMVFLEVVLNGFVVSSRMTVVRHENGTESSTQEVAIPLYMLQPGENVLRLRLHRDSMSTYRLFQAELRDRS